MQLLLPEECLTVVFLNLAHDRSALHALIQVSRQFFRLVAPILYRSPFRLLESKTENWSWSERTQRQVLLLQLLLHSAQIKQSDREARQQRYKNKRQVSYFREQKNKDKNIKNIMGSVIDAALTTIDISEWYLKFGGRTTSSTKLKKKQPWWSKKQSSTKESNSSTSLPRSLLFLPAISKKEINVAAVHDNKNNNLQGGNIPFHQQPMSLCQDNQLEAPSINSVNHQSELLMPDDDYLEIEHISDPKFSSYIRPYHHRQENNSHSQNCSKNAHAKEDNNCSCNDEISPLSRLSDSDIDDDGSCDSEDELPVADSLFSKDQPAFEPNLGPFSSVIAGAPTKSWSQILQNQLKSFRGIRNTGKTKKDQEFKASTALKPMTDYLSYYSEQDHPRLARVLSSLFPNLPVENFDHLLTVRDPMPNGPRSSRPFILDIFQSLRQPTKHSESYKKAISVLTMVERELLHHSPRKIKSMSLSASRFPLVIRPPNRQQPRPEPGYQPSLPNKPFSSLISLFIISPFTKSIAAPSPILPVWHSSPSSFSVFSSLSSNSSLSPSLLTDERSWNSIPNLSHLSHLYRLEIYGIHPKIDVGAVVEFLKFHDQTYDTIREVKLGGPDDLGRPSHPNVVQILQSLKKIKVLDMTEWTEAISFLHQFPTQNLETLLLGTVRTTAMQISDSTIPLPHVSEVNDQEDTVHPQIQALQRCRLLRELRMPVLVEGLFEWAANERQLRQLNPLVESIIKTNPMKAPPYWHNDHEPLVQLEDVHLNGAASGHLTSTLIHVVDAFRESLQTLQSSSWTSMETPICDLSLSWSWQLPQLRVLELQGEIAQRFLVQSLRYCPMLKILRLSLPHYAVTIPPWALSKNQENFESSDARCVHSRCQGCGNGNLGCSNCGLKAQPLSFVDYLCPYYNTYHNDMHSGPPMGVTRMKQKQQQQQREQPQPQPRVVLFPELEELRLVGDWGLNDDSVLEMAYIMPRLTRLSLLQCESEHLSARGLIRALARLREKNQGGLKYLEVNKTWQNELETKAWSDSGCGSSLVINYQG